MDKQTLIDSVISAQQGDMNAFANIYEATHDKVFFLALTIVRDEQTALDITQDSFVTLFTSIKNLTEPQAFPTWFNHIMINRCKDYVKRKRPVLFDDSDQEQYITESLEDATMEFLPQSALDNMQTRQMIMDIINSLPEAQRMTVLLHYYEELAIFDISRVMDCSEGTVKSRLYAAREKIRQAVLEHERNGVKLYGIGIAPLLTLLLRQIAQEHTMSPETARRIFDNAVAQSGINNATPSKSLTSKARHIAHKVASSSIKSKITAGIIALCIVSGSIAIVNMGKRQPVKVVPAVTVNKLVTSMQSSSTPSSSLLLSSQPSSSLPSASITSIIPINISMDTSDTSVKSVLIPKTFPYQDLELFRGDKYISRFSFNHMGKYKLNVIGTGDFNLRINAGDNFSVKSGGTFSVNGSSIPTALNVAIMPTCKLEVHKVVNGSEVPYRFKITTTNYSGIYSGTSPTSFYTFAAMGVMIQDIGSIHGKSNYIVFSSNYTIILNMLDGHTIYQTAP